MQDQINEKIDSTGEFHFSFETYIPTDVWLIYRTNFQVLVHPGDCIYVEFDGNATNRSELLSTIKYGGDASKSNYDASAFQKMYFSSKQCYSVTDNAMKDYGVIDFTLYLDTLQQEEDDLYNQFISEVKPNEETKNWANAFITSDYINTLIGYPSIHRALNQLKYCDWHVPPVYFDDLKKLSAIKESMFINGVAIKRFTAGYNKYISIKNFNNESNKEYRTENGFLDCPLEIRDSISVYSIVNYTNDPLLRQLALTQLFSLYFHHSIGELYEKYRDVADEYIQEPFLKEPLLKKYQQIDSEKNNQLSYINVKLNDKSNSVTKQLLDSVVATNKGRVICVVCWGTWCKGCLAEMPYIKQLMSELEGENVAFVFLCMESKKSNWEKEIKKLQLEGQQILLTKEQGKNIRKALNFAELPHQFLIDKRGTVIEDSELSIKTNAKEKIAELENK